MAHRTLPLLLTGGCSTCCGQHWCLASTAPGHECWGGLCVQIWLGRAAAGLGEEHISYPERGQWWSSIGATALPPHSDLELLMAQKMPASHCLKTNSLSFYFVLAKAPWLGIQTPGGCSIFPYSPCGQLKPHQLQRLGLEYLLQTAGWEVTHCRWLAWLIQQLFENIFEQLEKLVICSLTMGPQGAIQRVTYYNESPRAVTGTFCSMLCCWQELKNGKSEQAKHVSATWGNVRPWSSSFPAGTVMLKAGTEPQQQAHGGDTLPCQHSCLMGNTKEMPQKESFCFKISCWRKKKNKKDIISSLLQDKQRELSHQRWELKTLKQRKAKVRRSLERFPLTE